MYAIVRTGGKQYRVRPGDRVRVEKLAAEPGDEVVFEDVVFVSDGETVKVGTPRVKGAAVRAEVVAHGRGPKLIVFKKKRRKNYRRKAGHRQWYTEVFVREISVG